MATRTVSASRASPDVLEALDRAHDALLAVEHLQSAMASVVDVLGDSVGGRPGDYGQVCALEACIWSLTDKIVAPIDETRSLLSVLKATTQEASHV